MHPTLYKRDSGGRLRIWFLERKDEKYRAHSGLADGSLAVSGWTVATPKNAGKSNATTPAEQAEIEVEAAYTKKLEREYFRTVEETDTPRFFKPMLAEKYAGGGDFPIYTQPKLDGIRAIISIKGATSREGQPIETIPHILDALAPFFHDYPEAILDGELYNHAFKDDFNEITSLVKKYRPVRTEELVQYHVYDYPSEARLNFSDRNALLHTDLPKVDCIVMVETGLAMDQGALDASYADYLVQGYEGQMVRLDQPYEQKRSKTLLKRKEFETAEFELLTIEEGLGNWAGVAKKVTCRLPDGRVFGAGIKGDRKRAEALLTETYAQVTIRYFTLTPDGVPRFPVVIAFHEAGPRL